jgi:hypothetical protein
MLLVYVADSIGYTLRTRLLDYSAAAGLVCYITDTGNAVKRFPDFCFVLGGGGDFKVVAKLLLSCCEKGNRLLKYLN